MLRFLASIGIASLVIGLTVQNALAADQSVMLSLAPHCEERPNDACPTFTPTDGTHLTTEALNTGDLVDIDIVLKAENPSDVLTVRSWLQYNSSALEARSIDIGSVIKTPFPGENTIDEAQGIIKIGGDIDGEKLGKETTIARVTFRVIDSRSRAEIRFQGFQFDGLGHTAVNGDPKKASSNNKGPLAEPPCFDQIVGCGTRTNALLRIEPSTLILAFAQTENNGTNTSSTAPKEPADQKTQLKTSSASSKNHSEIAEAEAASPQSETTSSVASEPGNNPFTLLQIQNLRITTRDRDLLLGWSPLRSARLRGYNVYYGTVSGRYIQRKSIPGTTASLVLHDLEPGTTYYVALRGFDDAETETAFSQEVSVMIGDPNSSTSRLEGGSAESNVVDDTTSIEYEKTQNAGVVQGETGMSSNIMLFLMISASVGTIGAALRHTTHRIS